MHPTLRKWKTQKSFYVHSVPTKVMVLWHHAELENFGGKSWATKWPKQHWMHLGTPLQDASNTQKVKNTKVILDSFSAHQDDGVVAPFKSGGIWTEMLGDQMAQTALDAPRHTFARCIQHRESENNKGHFRFIHHPPRWWCCGTIQICRNLVRNVGRPNGPNSIGCTQAHHCKMHPTLRKWI